MPTYVIERNIPNAGRMSDEECRAVSRKSREVIDAMNGRVEWLESHVTGDRIYCLYRAADEAAIREHASLGGFPADRIARVERKLGP
jgi:hypothetical protein